MTIPHAPVPVDLPEEGAPTPEQNRLALEELYRLQETLAFHLLGHPSGVVDRLLEGPESGVTRAGAGTPETGRASRTGLRARRRQALRRDLAALPGRAERARRLAADLDCALLLDLTDQALLADGPRRGELRHASVRCCTLLGRLVHANTGLVHRVATRTLPVFCRRGPLFEDAIQEGLLGLSIALGKFAPACGVRLSTYAYPWIRQQVARWFDRQVRFVRLPVNRAGELRRVREYHAQHPEATASRVAEELGLPQDRVRDWLSFPRVVPLDDASERRGVAVAAAADGAPDGVDLLLAHLRHLPLGDRLILDFAFGLAETREIGADYLRAVATCSRGLAGRQVALRRPVFLGPGPAASRPAQR